MEIEIFNKILEQLSILPEENRVVIVILIIVIVAIIFILKNIKPKIKNSGNLNNSQIDESSKISIKTKSFNEGFDEINSNNLNNSKIGKNVKISIGDKNEQ